MSEDFLGRLLAHIHANASTVDGIPIYENTDHSPINIILGLTNGNVIRGQIVSAERWLQINTFGNSAPKLLENGESFDAAGSWPPGFVYAPDDAERFSTIYLTMVEFLSGDRWISGCSVCVGTGRVEYQGDQYLSSR